MMFFNKLIKNPQALKLFLILLLGFSVIYAAGYFVSNTHRRNKVSHRKISVDIINMVGLAESLQAKTVNQIINYRRNRFLNIHFANQPMKKAEHFFRFAPQKIHRAILKSPKDIKISVKLSNSKWLNIRYLKPHRKMTELGYYSVISILVLMLLLLCGWVVTRITVPIDKLTQAVRQFGKDIHAPPLAETGSKEAIEVIQAFNQMQARIRRLLSDRGQMLAAISHDLRTPITRLKLRTENIADENLQNKMQDDLNEMEHMITSILFFIRDHNQSEIIEKLDLNALIETICDDLIDTGHDVKFYSKENSLPFNGRLSGLKRTFSNLIENAVKYGQEARVDLAKQENKIIIKISDQGPGIPESELEKVFLPFYRTDAARSPTKTGSGLGLAIARDIIHAHGGEIKLSNNHDKGLCVTVILPLLMDK